MAGHLLVVSVALLSALAVPAIAAAKPLEGTVGPGATITLKHANGSPVRHAHPGPRAFVIDDLSTVHDFHLYGPGVARKTGIAFTGERRWRVALRVGTYRFRCDAHPRTMHGHFAVS
jgi:hypothetical protein